MGRMNGMAKATRKGVEGKSGKKVVRSEKVEELEVGVTVFSSA
jgi:hypothetical protein